MKTKTLSREMLRTLRVMKRGGVRVHYSWWCTWFDAAGRKIGPSEITGTSLTERYYPTIATVQALEKRGLLSRSTEGEGLKAYAVYSLTEAGAKAADEAAE